MPGLSGCLVVRNGKKSVAKCLDALLPLVNEYVIIDTGSSDGTMELVSGWAKAHPRCRVVTEEVGSRFHDEDGIFDFGAAKTYAISKATCQYVLWVDVNDEVTKGAEVRRAFEKIVNRIPHASITMLTEVDSKFAFPRVRIAPREFASFCGSIHEYMINSAPDYQVVTTKFRVRNYKSYRDVSRNVKALMKEWGKSHTQRTAFYMGNSARDMNDFATALDWYVITVDEFPEMANEERAKSIESICDIALRDNKLDILNDRSWQLIAEIPDRPEGYFYRAKYQYAVGNYAMAAKCMRQLLKLNAKVRPTHMWINPDIYDRKRHVDMLKEVELKAQYSNMTPIAPCIEDASVAMAGGQYVGQMAQQQSYGGFGTILSQNIN